MSETSQKTEADQADLAALFASVAAQDAAFDFRLIAAYRRHGYQRDLADPPVIWSEGETRLFDHGGTGPAVLFVPSLVNRAYILDLMQDASFMRWLAANGAHPFLLDWGWPGEIERGFSLTDYIAGRLERAIGAFHGPIILAGYCMGGLLALAAALRAPAKISALALLATPWDFHAADAAQAKKALGIAGDARTDDEIYRHDADRRATDPVHHDRPVRRRREISRLCRPGPNSARAQRFVAMEDWLADGVPLSAPIARETLGGWYGANSPAAGKWRVAGLAVQPEKLEKPCFIAAPARDKLVPPESVRPLAKTIAGATYIEPRAGHIGMIAGTNARDALWEPFKAWLEGL